MTLRRPPSRASLGAIVAGILIVSLCACEAPDTRPDVILITVGSVRADHVGAYGATASRTPAIDRLAAEGVRFEQAITPAPIRLPAHVSLFTASLPMRHGVRDDDVYALAENVPTLAEILQSEGYRTGAFVSAAGLDPAFGLARGFDAYDAPARDPDDESGARLRRGAETTRAALDWVRTREDDRPLFLWVHLAEPESPDDSASLLDAPSRETYANGITLADAVVGQLVGGVESRRSRERVTVLTSDHGEDLGRHGEATHGLFLFESTLRVPLVIHAPGSWSGGIVVDEPVGLVDVAPTVLALVGSDAELGADGIALDPASVPRRRLVSETLRGFGEHGWAPMFALREGSQKVVLSRHVRVFDLISDPEEKSDLGDDDAPWSRNLLDALRTIVADSRPSLAPFGVRRPLSAGSAQALATLGYAGRRMDPGEVNTGATLLEAIESRPDALERGHELDALRRASTALRSGRTAHAIEELEAVLADNPGNGRAQWLLADALERRGDHAEAADAYELASRLHPRRFEPLVRGARAYVRTNRFDAAVPLYERALDLRPADTELLREAVAVFSDAGRTNRALARVEVAIELGDGDTAEQAELLGLMSAVCLQASQIDRAEDYLRRARALRDAPIYTVVQGQILAARGRWRDLNDLFTPLPAALTRDAAAVELKGLALERLDEPERALQLYRSAVAIDSRRDVAHARIGALLLRLHADGEGALRETMTALELAPHRPEHHAQYVSILETLGETERARAHLRTWGTEFPGHEALANLAERLGVDLGDTR